MHMHNILLTKTPVKDNKTNLQLQRWLQNVLRMILRIKLKRKVARIKWIVN